MRPSVKAGLALATTLALGILIGVLSAGALGQRRPPPPPPGAGRGGGGGRGGFVELVEGVLQPRDSAQRAALRPHLAATDRHNRAIVDAARESMRLAMDSLRIGLVPIIDRSQLERFDDFVRRQPRDGRGPPGLGGRGGPPP